MGMFFEALVRPDCGLALEANHEAPFTFSGTTLVKELYHAVQAAGGAGKGTQDLILGPRPVRGSGSAG